MEATEDMDWQEFEATEGGDQDDNPPPPPPPEPTSRQSDSDTETDTVTVSATLTVYCNDNGLSFVSRNGGATWTSLTSSEIDRVDADTVIRHSCKATEEIGGFLATLEFEGESYSTTDPLDAGYWSLISSSDGDEDLVYFEANVEGIGESAVWVWNNVRFSDFDFLIGFQIGNGLNRFVFLFFYTECG